MMNLDKLDRDIWRVGTPWWTYEAASILANRHTTTFKAYYTITKGIPANPDNPNECYAIVRYIG